MKKILIIEDDAFLQDLEANKLKKDNFQIVTAGTGEEALEKIKEPDIDLILLDLILPGIDGFDILKKVKEDPELKKIPVIVFSNLSSDEDIKRADSLGAAQFMVKSNFSLDELSERISKILS